HLNRVGAVVGAFRMEEGGGRKYSAIGALHDAVEDLLSVACDEEGRLYGLERYGDFIEEFLPAELHAPVLLLTNHYDLILQDIRSRLRRENRSLTGEELVSSLAAGLPGASPALNGYMSRMADLLAGEPLGPDPYEGAKWLCYRRLYVRDMARDALAARDFRTYEIKAVDLSDNANGRDALAMWGRIKNIVKMDIWAREGYALGSSWHPLNSRIMELEEDALVHAEHLVLRDFLESVSCQDFVMSGLLKIGRLSTVFYVGEPAGDPAVGG
ncbi:MAG: hypothetical protein WB626_00690, partial [Bacteroidota bacterium]